MKTFVSCILFLSATAACASPPLSNTCAIKQPPSDSGEDFAHGVTLKVYPRASSMGKEFSGCQLFWMPAEKNEWRLLSVVEIQHGKATSFRDMATSEHFTCEYSAGVLKRGPKSQCPVPEDLIHPSFPSGCAARMMTAKGQVEGCNMDALDR